MAAPAVLAFVLSCYIVHGAQHKIAVSVDASGLATQGVGIVRKPKATTLETIGDADLSDGDMEAIPHAFFAVEVMAYKHLEAISNNLREYASWETDSVSRFCREFKRFGSKGNFLDVGANIGAITLPVAACMKDRSEGTSYVISVEASPRNARHLKAGVQRSKLANVRLYEYAVSSPDAPNNLNLTAPWNNQGQSTLDKALVREEKGLQTMSVPVTTLDDIAKSEGADMKNIFGMKIDIEGHEELALLGAKQFFKDGGPCMIFVELQFNEGLQEVIEHLGYQVQYKHWAMPHNTWFQRKDMDACVANLK